MSVEQDPFGDLLEWGGDAVVFDYDSKLRGTFGVTGRVIERSSNTLRFEANTETGPGISEAEANWTGRLEIQSDGIQVWAEASDPRDSDHLKGRVA
jgi:hypothetical protein